MNQDGQSLARNEKALSFKIFLFQGSINKHRSKQRAAVERLGNRCMHAHAPSHSHTASYHKIL